DRGPTLLTEVGPQALEAVDSLVLQVDAGRFPEVRLRLEPSDAEGRWVEGLDAAAFAVYDDELPVAALLHQNRWVPRVVLILDQSGSMPPEFSSEAATELCLSIARRVFATEGSELVMATVAEQPSPRFDFVATEAEVA